MDQQVTQWVIMVVLALLTIYALYKASQAGKVITVGEVLQTAKDNYPLALQVKEVAEMAVFAAEEFSRTNDLPMLPEDKLKTAINIFRRWIPLSEVDDIAMIEAIHSFIPKINALTPERKKLP